MDEIIGALRRDNYCLMTNETGSGLKDNEGNLLLCKIESGEVVSVPNIKAVRELYDLPLEEEIETDDKKKSINITAVDDFIFKHDGKNGDFGVGVEDEEEEEEEDSNTLVWIGQRTRRSVNATRTLIELFDSPRYQRMMRDRCTIKLKVWEKIGMELQKRGFKVANTMRDAGLRTFQKWRNLERTYWRYVKNPQDFGDEKRRKKPMFFDELHAVLTKRDQQKLSAPKNDRWPKAGLVASLGRLKGGEIPLRAVETLLNLMDSNKYQVLFSGGGRRSRVWESIYDDLRDMGFEVPGETKRDKSQRLFQKWRNLKRCFIKYNQAVDSGSYAKKPMFYELLSKLIYKEKFPKKSSLNSDDVEELIPPNFLQFSHKDHDYEVTGTPPLDPMSTQPQTSSHNISVLHTDHTLHTSLSHSIPVEVSVLNTSCSAFPAPSSNLVSSGAVKSNAAPKLNSTLPPLLPKLTPNHSTKLRSSDVLQQIKALHEITLSVQQQHFAKVVSLLEEQIRNQNTLNSLISTYLSNQSKKVKSKHKSNGKINLLGSS